MTAQVPDGIPAVQIHDNKVHIIKGRATKIATRQLNWGVLLVFVGVVAAIYVSQADNVLVVFTTMIPRMGLLFTQVIGSLSAFGPYVIAGIICLGVFLCIKSVHTLLAMVADLKEAPKTD